MFGSIEIALLSATALLLLFRVLPYLGSYRPLCGAAGILLLITALFPRPGNPLGQFLFAASGFGLHLPPQLFGIVWWVLGAWLFKSLLQLLLSRMFFADNNEPHARRLFADLATALIYVLAFFGIVDTVFHQPVSTFVATSGVLAIVLGLALQNTLGDVLAGLAINIENPFRAGDWITLAEGVSGQVMQVNWRATRLRTWSHDMVIIPNSVASKAIITNHSRPAGPHRCTIGLKVDLAVAPSLVIEALQAAAGGAKDLVHGTAPRAYALAFSDCLVEYELAFAIESFALSPDAQSDMLARIADEFRDRGIQIGSLAMAVRVVAGGDLPATADLPPKVRAALRP